jgi:hypothetical protein
MSRAGAVRSSRMVPCVVPGAPWPSPRSARHRRPSLTPSLTAAWEAGSGADSHTSNHAPSVQEPRRKRPGRLLADLRRVRCPHGWRSRSAPDILRTRTAHSLGSAGVLNNLSLRRMKLPKEPRMSLRQWCSPRQRLLRTTSRHSRATPFQMLIVARTEQPL